MVGYKADDETRELGFAGGKESENHVCDSWPAWQEGSQEGPSLSETKEDYRRESA